MQLNKKIMLMLLSISSYGVVMGMETDKKEAQESKQFYFLIKKTSENQARYLAIFARENNQDTVSALSVANWLVLKRKDIVEDRSWTEFMDVFVFHLTGNHRIGEEMKNKKLDAVADVVRKTAYGFKTGENDARLLVDRAVEALSKVGQ